MFLLRTSGGSERNVSVPRMAVKQAKGGKKNLGPETPSHSLIPTSRQASIWEDVRSHREDVRAGPIHLFHPCPLSEVRAPVAAPLSTSFGKSWALANLTILVPLFYSKFLDRIRRK